MKIIAFLFFLVACTGNHSNGEIQKSEPEEAEFSMDGLDTATFAGGCFWCTEAVFERVKGVKNVYSGYTGGREKDPGYKEVSAGKTGHAEAIRILYDPEVISYKELITIFFGTHDPTTVNRQGPDVGKQYRSEVFFHNPMQEKVVRDYLAFLEKEGVFPNPVVTKVSPAGKFYTAEKYHQDYYRLNPQNPYIQSIAVPKVKKFKKNFPQYYRGK